MPNATAPAPFHPTPQPDTAARKRRGNPNLALAPRCGARTRTGCPCRAPALHGKLRCRMHGGGSTGPRTAEGLARLRAARTTHGGYTPEARAFQRHVLTTLRRNRTFVAAMRYRDRLPPNLAERLLSFPPELALPPYPAAGLSVAEDRILLHAEREALAPWKDAIAAAKGAGRLQAATAPLMQGPHTPEQPASRVPADVPDHRYGERHGRAHGGKTPYTRTGGGCGGARGRGVRPGFTKTPYTRTRHALRGRARGTKPSPRRPSPPKSRLIDLPRS